MRFVNEKNSVVIASTAGCLVEMLSEKLSSVNLNVYKASNDKDLFIKINNYFPRFVFIENCYHNEVTDKYVYKIKRTNENLHIVIWTASEITPFNAARFINAGAESFLSLREEDEKVIIILKQIILGKFYCPDDVLKECDRSTTNPNFNKPLTGKEKQVIKFFYLHDKEIALKLCITENTVKFHKKNIFKKTGLNNKIAVSNWANEQRITQIKTKE